MSEVHDGAIAAQARDVIDFWFALDPKAHWAKDPALDATISQKFAALRDTVLATDAAGWRDEPDTLLAAIILLDQFSRNIHRGTAAAYAGDPLAVELAVLAIELGWDVTYPAAQRAFVYMPLMHAEDGDLQTLSVAKFEAAGDTHNVGYAHDHADMIARFGRFPSRNAALGRESTPAEQDYLSRPDAGW